eukprot:6482303-Amphidinium_carterae.1
MGLLSSCTQTTQTSFSTLSTSCNLQGCEGKEGIKDTSQKSGQGCEGQAGPEDTSHKSQQGAFAKHASSVVYKSSEKNRAYSNAYRRAEKGLSHLKGAALKASLLDMLPAGRQAGKHPGNADASSALNAQNHQINKTVFSKHTHTNNANLASTWCAMSGFMQAEERNMDVLVECCLCKAMSHFAMGQAA